MRRVGYTEAQHDKLLRSNPHYSLFRGYHGSLAVQKRQQLSSFNWVINSLNLVDVNWRIQQRDFSFSYRRQYQVDCFRLNPNTQEALIIKRSAQSAHVKVYYTILFHRKRILRNNTQNS